MRDLLILGGGVAAMSAAIYAGRKKLDVAVVAGEIGGQSALQPEFYNYPGFVDVDGYKLIQNMKKQVMGLAVDLFEPWFVERLKTKKENGREVFSVMDKEGKALEAKSVLVATGGKPKFLNVPGEQEYANKGVTYCATCDAPLFAGKRTVVVGGGNTGTESALLLTKYATKVYLLHRGSELKADEITREQIRNAKDKIEIIYNALTIEIRGKDGRVTGLRYKDKKTGAEHELLVEGIFIAIGFAPNSSFATNHVEVNTFGEIITDPHTNMTSHEGIFAAGDVTNIPYKQAIIAAGDAAKAALSIHQWLMGQKNA